MEGPRKGGPERVRIIKDAPHPCDAIWRGIHPKSSLRKTEGEEEKVKVGVLSEAGWNTGWIKGRKEKKRAAKGAQRKFPKSPRSKKKKIKNTKKGGRRKRRE